MPKLPNTADRRGKPPMNEFERNGWIGLVLTLVGCAIVAVIRLSRQ